MRVAFGIGCALIAAAWVIGSVPVGLTGAVVAFLALMIPHLPHVDDWDRRVLGDDAAP